MDVESKLFSHADSVFCVSLFFLATASVCSQTEVSIQFVPCWKDGQVISANQIIADSSIDSLLLNTLRFYLHNVELTFEGKQELFFQPRLLVDTYLESKKKP
jgi:hypothetical protein